MSEFDDDYEFDLEEMRRREDEHALSPAGIAEENARQIRRYREFRLAADAVTAAWRERPEVLAVSLIGSLARAPWKEVPHHNPYRRARIELWHDISDLDLALWLSDMSDLNGLRRSKEVVLRDLQERGSCGVASHQTDVFVIEPGTDLYLGRLCNFNRCPKEKPECQVEGCGATAHLKQHDGFCWRPNSLAPDRSIRLFDRATGKCRLAAELSLPDDDAPTGPIA
ncbi:MAG: hypothetical protein ABFS30_12145 [Pseudomonadota bacterium]